MEARITARYENEYAAWIVRVNGKAVARCNSEWTAASYVAILVKFAEICEIPYTKDLK